MVIILGTLTSTLSANQVESVSLGVSWHPYIAAMDEEVVVRIRGVGQTELLQPQSEHVAAAVDCHARVLEQLGRECTTDVDDPVFLEA